MIKYRPVTHLDYGWIYRLLGERDKTVNISHRKMPTMAEHVRFCQSAPYFIWEVMMDGTSKVGHYYLTRGGEIGYFVAKEHRGHGYGRLIVSHVLSLYRGKVRLLANINPLNEKSIKLIQKFGFRHIQNTYELAK
jgi:RimJ/RimL family protein N-acetyltransferase